MPDTAINAWKAAHRQPGALSPEARNRVLRSVLTSTDRGSLPGLASLFPAYRRMILATVLPVGLVALALALGLGGGAMDQDNPPVAISVEKVGNQVVFNIENGGTPHSVSKSHTPHSFDPRQAVLIEDGSYRDAMVGNGDLVFYRID